jgi:hypothetical protein
MKKTKLKNADHAVVGVVTAVLLIGLIVAVVSLIQTIYIPKIMEEREAEHMDKVSEQFTYLTSVIDGQAADQSQNLPVATSITLGSKELPYMLSIKAFGTIEILDSARQINISLANGTAYSYPVGVISYSSINGYFLDQTYTYEAGAMIVSQSQGNLMMVRPNFFIDYDQTQNILNISFTLINISSVGQKTIASGFGTYPIQTEFHQVAHNETFTDVTAVRIMTPFSNAWFVYLESVLQSALDGNNYDLTDTGDALVLDNFSSLTVNVFFTMIDIHAQIGPGWVEQ